MKTSTKVIGLNLKDGTQVCFDSIKDASRYLNLDDSHITKCIKGSRKSHGGYSWSLAKISEEKSRLLKSVKKEKSFNVGDLVKADRIIFSDLNFTPEEWSEDEDKIIRKFYPCGKLSDIVTKIARDVTSITLRAKVLGLRRSHVHSKNRSHQDLLNIVVDSKDNEIGSEQ